jgi:hypothetical protein
MAGERVMWLVWHPDKPTAYPSVDKKEAQEKAARYEMFVQWDEMAATGWRCSQITVKEADGE